MPRKRYLKLAASASLRIVLPALLTNLLFLFVIFFIFLPQIESSFIARRKELIREQTETAWSLLVNYRERELSGELSTEAAKERALLRIGRLRYGPEKKDYFWINDMTPRMLMHPYRPDLMGQVVEHYEDPAGKFLFRDFIRVAQEKGEGFVEYTWQWKDDPGRISRKVSYIKKFEPWDWIIGTGLYFDEIYTEVAAIKKQFLLHSLGILAITTLLSLVSIRQSLLVHREREDLMRSLEKSKERFRNLVETTGDWIWETDAAGKYTYSSPQVEGLLSYQPEEIVGNTLQQLASPNQSTTLSQAIASLFANQRPFSNLEITCFGKQGQVVVFEHNAVPIFDDQGGLTGYRGVARDITERKIALEALRKSHDDLHTSLEETVQSLALATEKRDPYTAGHQQRVDRLACAIATEMGLEEERIQGLHIAALLHDIGKITLPSEYLAKPTKLTTEERAIIRCHTEVGYDILKNIHFPWPVAEIVRQHHEHLDGSGYPQGLMGEAICLEARILTVADVVEAMSSHRPYRPSLGLNQALDEIRNGQGTLYDTSCVDVCLHLILDKQWDFSGEVQP